MAPQRTDDGFIRLTNPTDELTPDEARQLALDLMKMANEIEADPAYRPN